MRVILLQNVEKVGKKYEVKEVKNGYARNFLIPKGLAKPATKKALKWLEVQKEIEAKKSEEELKKIQDFVSKVDGLELVFPVKVGEKGELFESINNQKISEKLKAMGFEIKKTQIDLKEPIKELGEFPVKIHFEHNLEAEVRVIVVEEK
jgi:large subunit ribosomal protein L9